MTHGSGGESAAAPAAARGGPVRNVLILGPSTLHPGWGAVEQVERILALAARRGDPVLLMTFATYLPENYSLEAFRAKRLDYRLHRVPIEKWGAGRMCRPPLRSRATSCAWPSNIRRRGFVDQARLLPGSGRYFNDPCHFTVAGSEKFVENLLPAVLSGLRAR